MSMPAGPLVLPAPAQARSLFPVRYAGGK